MPKRDTFISNWRAARGGQRFFSVKLSRLAPSIARQWMGAKKSHIVMILQGDGMKVERRQSSEARWLRIGRLGLMDYLAGM